jgi:hypothetical protein
MSFQIDYLILRECGGKAEVGIKDIPYLDVHLEKKNRTVIIKYSYDTEGHCIK